jgi:hypothetical protein
MPQTRQAIRSQTNLPFARAIGTLPEHDSRFQPTTWLPQPLIGEECSPYTAKVFRLLLVELSRSAGGAPVAVMRELVV